MKIKKLTAFVCAVLMMSSIFAISVSANIGYQRFRVYINGGAVVSSFAYTKSGIADSMYTYTNKYPGTSVNWLSSETVNLRGRTSSGTKCTALGTRNTEGSRYLKYDPGYGRMNTAYKVAVQYDSSNPYTNLDLGVTWEP